MKPYSSQNVFCCVKKNFLLDISVNFLILSIIMNRLFLFVKKQTKRIGPFPSGRRVCGV